MDKVLGQNVLQFTTVYVDDLLITSTYWDDHCTRVEQVLKKLSDNNITLRLDKSRLIAGEVQFLGFIISETGIVPAPNKVEAIQNFPTPKNKKQLQSFLGLCNYYRKFQQNYSELTAQFKPQLTTHDKWRWGEQQSQTFKTIKEKFLETIILHHPDFTRPYFMNCDASNVSVGAELYQEDDGGNHLVIGFASRTLNKCEKNYTVTEKELLSIIFACNKFRTYILGYPTTVRSDHKSISFLKNCKLGHGRLTRWILALQEYSINWEYVPGRKNIVADTLSRVNLDQNVIEMDHDEIARVYHIIKGRKELEDIIERIRQHQKIDPKLRQIRQRTNDGDAMINTFHCVYDDMLFTRNKAESDNWKIVVPERGEKELIVDYHVRYGHMGPQKVVRALKEHFQVKGVNKKVRAYLKTCRLCQLVKVNNERKEGVMIPITSKHKLEKLFLDICGPFPRSGGRKQYQFIVIMFDHFSKYTKLYPINRATSKKILELITDRFIPELGKPQTLITDHGTQFKGKVWKETLGDLGIKTYKTSVYHPSSNPAERVLREVGRILRTYCHSQQKQWSNYVEPTETFLNLAHHETTKHTPYMIMHEKSPPREITEILNFPATPEYQFDRIKFYNQVLEQVNERREKYKKYPRSRVKYAAGEKVLLRNRQLPSSLAGIAKKMLLLYNGPYTITRDNANNTYELTDPTTQQVKGTYNRTELRKYYED